MKTFLKFFLLLILTLNLRAATNDVAKFSGTVVDAQGNPVTNATVELYQYPPRTFFGPMDMDVKQHIVTDAQGAFEFPLFQGYGIVLVKKTGLPPAWRTWYAAPLEPQKIVLSAPSSLAGVVIDSTGAPVADVEVQVSSTLNKITTDNGQPNFLSGKMARELFSTRTSADGKFRIEDFPADAQAYFSVKKSGMALHPPSASLRYDELPFHSGQEDIVLNLDPAGSVSGKVVIRGTGQPLAGAMVGLEPATPGIGYLSFDQEPIISAADGSFQISDVPAGSYQVAANFTNQPVPDWVADSVPVAVAAGQAVSDVQLQAYKGGVVEVTVRAKDSHELLADVGVSANNEDFNRGSLTETNGVAYLRLPPGQFSIYANKENWSPVQTQATATDGQTTEVTIDLAPPFKISGVLRDASGAPVSGASVGVSPNYWGNDVGAKSDANGHYELTWTKPGWNTGTSQFYLVARQPERKLAAIQDMDETTTNLDMTLKPAMSVSGHVQDTTGKPVTNAVAYVALHFDQTSFTINRQPVHSDAQGRIYADALPMGQHYGWYVSAPGYGGGHQEMDAADPTADHYDFPPLIVAVANRKLAGRVLGTNGAPVAGVQIWMNGEGQPSGNATTDANGRFAFDAVCDGAVSVSAQMKSLYGSADAMGGDTNIVIRFNARDRVYQQQPSRTLTGVVNDSSGNHVAGAVVIVTPTWGAENVVKSDANGEFSINWQPEQGMQNVKYLVIARDIERNLAAIETISTNKTSVTLQLEPSLSISGTVQDAKGAPLKRANVNLNIMAGNAGGMVEYQPIKVDANGVFAIPALPMGQTYHVYISANGYGSVNRSIGKTRSETNSIQLPPLKLKAANLQLAGEVLGTDGKALSGAQVNINGNGQPNGNMRTDAAGHFKFKVCDGPISIFAWAPSGSGRNNSVNWMARGGDTNVIIKMGARQPPNQIVLRETPLKPQAWTMTALVTWPVNHKIGAIILFSLQAAALVGAAVWIFQFIRKRKDEIQ